MQPLGGPKDGGGVLAEADEEFAAPFAGRGVARDAYPGPQDGLPLPFGGQAQPGEQVFFGGEVLSRPQDGAQALPKGGTRGRVSQATAQGAALVVTGKGRAAAQGQDGQNVLRKTVKIERFHVLFDDTRFWGRGKEGLLVPAFTKMRCEAQKGATERSGAERRAARSLQKGKAGGRKRGFLRFCKNGPRGAAKWGGKR